MRQLPDRLLIACGRYYALREISRQYELGKALETVIMNAGSSFSRRIDPNKREPTRFDKEAERSAIDKLAVHYKLGYYAMAGTMFFTVLTRTGTIKFQVDNDMWFLGGVRTYERTSKAKKK